MLLSPLSLLAMVNSGSLSSLTNVFKLRFTLAYLSFMSVSLSFHLFLFHFLLFPILFSFFFSSVTNLLSSLLNLFETGSNIFKSVSHSSVCSISTSTKSSTNLLFLCSPNGLFLSLSSMYSSCLSRPVAFLIFSMSIQSSMFVLPISSFPRYPYLFLSSIRISVSFFILDWFRPDTYRICLFFLLLGSWD
uniref:Uncharacterized protein n=1 Tax=Cacopsylla melanoneura TaxID=428564 RepID=A0A8D8M8M5_9HEMI